MKNLAVTLAVCLLATGPASAEYIFRGQCSSLMQSQEVAMTIDPEDVVFGVYVIPPVNRTSANVESCEMECLATTRPTTCRSAFYSLNGKSCWLLRADKKTALEFDADPEQPGTVSGILIAPQALEDQVTDRAGGVPNCDSYCPGPATQSADTVTPVCIKDCANSRPVCAGEMGTCFDFPRRVFFVHPSKYWHFGGHTWMDDMRVYFKKKHDYTNLKVTYQFGGWVFRAGPDTVHHYLDEGYIHPYIFSTQTSYHCYGETANTQGISRQMEEAWNSNSYEESESVHGELPCTYYEEKAGTIDVRPYYTYNIYGARFGRSQAPGTSMNGYAPLMTYIEEYVPAPLNRGSSIGYMKIDDMSRCQSVTVFNSYSYQFRTSYGSSGRTSSYYIEKYKKRSDTSTLRIYFSGIMWLNAQRRCQHFFFTINDKLCENPYSIETSFRNYEWRTNNDRNPPDGVSTQLDGICRGLPAGSYDIHLWIDSSCPHYGHSTGSYWGYDMGRGRPSQMIVEEIHEDLPINALLMPDGEMVMMPYFNRHYYVFTTGCRVSGIGLCLNPIVTFTYNKRQDDSKLHIKWYGTQEYCTESETAYSEVIKWYVKLNGNECNDPLKVESWWYNGNNSPGLCRVRPKYVEGVCKMPISAGSVTVSLHVGYQHTGQGRWYGATLGGTSYLMVEELYDGEI